MPKITNFSTYISQARPLQPPFPPVGCCWSEKEREEKGSLAYSKASSGAIKNRNGFLKRQRIRGKCSLKKPSTAPFSDSLPLSLSLSLSAPIPGNWVHQSRQGKPLGRSACILFTRAIHRSPSAYIMHCDHRRAVRVFVCVCAREREGWN